jgi:hypothetical protein
MRKNILILPIVWSALLAMIGTAAYVSRRIAYPLADLFRDPAHALDGPWYAGLFSALGVTMWAAAAAICLFSFAVVRSRSSNRDARLFLLFFGLLTLLLCYDDLYQMHETIIPRWLGIPETAVLASYALLMGGALLRFRRTILQSDPHLLIAALACFGVAAIIDVSPGASPVITVVENSLELLGISAWLMYFGRKSFQLVMDADQVPTHSERRVATRRLKVWV